MDWPVIGSFAGVAALAASVAVGGWLIMSSTPTPRKNPSAPVLLVDTRPQQQSILYSSTQGRPPKEEPVLASIPRPDLAALPYSEREKPHRPLTAPRHPDEIEASRKSLVAKPRVETQPKRTAPAVVDERYAHVLTPEKVGQLRRMLHLRPDQTEHWPPVESMLHQIGRIQMGHIRRGEKPDVDSAVMMQLYSAAQPLLFTLAPEQKDKIRSLARSLGYPNVASLL
jgi:hypothetical protein